MYLANVMYMYIIVKEKLDFFILINVIPGYACLFSFDHTRQYSHGWLARISSACHYHQCAR